MPFQDQELGKPLSASLRQYFRGAHSQTCTNEILGTRSGYIFSQLGDAIDLKRRTQCSAMRWSKVFATHPGAPRMRRALVCRQEGDQPGVSGSQQLPVLLRQSWRPSRPLSSRYARYPAQNRFSKVCSVRPISRGWMGIRDKAGKDQQTDLFKPQQVPSLTLRRISAQNPSSRFLLLVSR